MRSALLAGLLCPLLLLSLACSSVQKPTASLRSAEVGAVNAEGFTVNFDLDVANSNSFNLPAAARA